MPFDAGCLSACGSTADAVCIEGCFQPEAPLVPIGAAIPLAGALVLLSGLFSGLNLGLLSLDLTGLKVVEQSGEQLERKYAGRLIRVCKHGNLLLCTLLLGNTVINSAISIILSSVTNGAVGLLTSTFVILLLGEIIPQALCSRHALMIGYHSTWIVKLFMILFLPITWPISRVLDWWLGKDIGTVYNQEQLKRLIAIHVEDPAAQAESGLTVSDQRLLTGVLEYKGKSVADTMTCLDACFMLELHTKLDFDVMTSLYMSGCSRVPVYEGRRDNIVGLLFVKDLILVDADDEMEVATIMAFRGRPVQRVYDHVTLDKVLHFFLSSNQTTHMIIAHKAPPNPLALHGLVECSPPGSSGHMLTRVSGLITLEDVMEEIIAAEIDDEADRDLKAAADAATAIIQLHQHGTAGGHHGPKHKRGDSNMANLGNYMDGTNPNVHTYLSLFDRKRCGNRLSAPEAAAVCAFLANSVDEFRGRGVEDPAFKGLVHTAEVVESTGVSSSSSQQGATEAEGPSLSLYQKGKPSAFFTLVLQGKVLVCVGSEGFESQLGPWSYMGIKALTTEGWVCDFDAKAVGAYRIVRISRASYVAATDVWRIGAAREYSAVKLNMRRAAVGTGSAQQPSEAASPSSSPAATPSGDVVRQSASMAGWDGSGGAGRWDAPGSVRQSPLASPGHVALQRRSVPLIEAAAAAAARGQTDPGSPHTSFAGGSTTRLSLRRPRFTPELVTYLSEAAGGVGDLDPGNEGEDRPFLAGSQRSS